KKKADENENKNEKKEDDDDKKKEKTTINIGAGVVAPDIADDLVDGKIIKKDERDDFIDYMNGEGYSEEVQLGKFKVDSEMDFKELAKTFITYPGESSR